MQRSELASTVLQLKALGVDNMMAFDWLAPPPAETMVRALELLHALGALGADARSATSPNVQEEAFRLGHGLHLCLLIRPAVAAERSPGHQASCWLAPL